MEETTTQYIERIRRTLTDCEMTVPDSEFYNKLKQERPDLKLTIKGQGTGIDEKVLIACERAKNK